MRSCYDGVWLLFQDDLSIGVPARYFFAPPNTPHYPGLHRFGSRNWYDSNWKIVQTPGESLTAKQSYDRGAQPFRIPLPQLIGSRACIEQGDTVADAVSLDTYVDGFLPNCFSTPQIGSDPLENVNAILQCNFQSMIATTIRLLYNGDHFDINTFIPSWLRAPVTITIHDAVGTMPGVVTLTGLGWSAAFVSGTQNFQTLALQAWESLAGPVNIGDFSTMPLWYLAAGYINALLTQDGAVPGEPVVLAGHSYGGAACTILAAMYKLATPARSVSLLTFGCPMIGDSRLVAAANLAASVHLADDNDLVTILPYPTAEMSLYVPVFGASIAVRWQGWEAPTPRLLLYDDGSEAWGEPPFPDWATSVALITRVLAQIPETGIIGHKLETYLQRLHRRCPDPHWPAHKRLKHWLDLPAVYHLALGADRLKQKPRLLHLLAKSAPSGKVDLKGKNLPPAGKVGLVGEIPPVGSLLLDGAELPAGALALVDVTPPGPGPTCSTSLAGVLGHVYSDTTTGTTHQWYVWPITAGTLYHIRATLVTWSGIGVNLYHGVNCASLVSIFPGLSSLTPCVEYMPAVNENLYFEIFGGLLGDTAYTVVTDLGHC